MKHLLNIILASLVLACSGGGSNEDPINEPPDKEPPSSAENKPPGISALVYPGENQLCVDSQLTFEWSDATDPEGGLVSYQLQISTNRGFTEVIEDLEIEGTSVTLTMNIAQDYYWKVRAIDSKGARGNYSDVWAFYVEGIAETNNIPFSPALTAPSEGSEQDSASVPLIWEGADSDGDFLSYDLYFGKTNPPPLFQTDLSASEFEVVVEAGSTYYWKVNVSDSKSESLGEVWSFVTK